MRRLLAQIGRCAGCGFGPGRVTNQLAVILPSLSRVTFTVTPSFTALPRHTPLASLRSPEIFAYPCASICDFAWSAVMARSVRFRPVVAASGGEKSGDRWRRSNSA